MSKEQNAVGTSCFACGGTVSWQNDFDFEDYGRIGEGIVHVYHCDSCNTMWEGYESFEDEYKEDEEDV